jgi:hypothetical protein
MISPRSAKSCRASRADGCPKVVNRGSIALWRNDGGRYDPHQMRLAFILVGACSAASCGPKSVTAVGNPGGVYQPNHGCTLVEASGDCPAPSVALSVAMTDGAAAADAASGPTSGNVVGPQLRFESSTGTGMMNQTPGTLSNLQVTCQRSFCGTGALAAHADFRWDDSIANDPRRSGTFVHTFDPPIDLQGHTVSFAVSVEGEGPKVPMHAQVGVVSDFWHWVAWSPVPATGGWTRIAGVVGPENPLTKLDPQATAVLVRAINIEVYVPVAGASGTTGTWSGAIYLDEAGW